MSSYAAGSTDVPEPGPSTSSIPQLDTPPRTAKIVLIGSASVGKTSLRNRFFKGSKGFSQAYIATIGADFVTKTLDVEQDGGSGKTRMALQLWDTAGQERFQALGAAFYRGADACIIVYACDSRPSADRLESWYNAFVDRCPLREGQERTFPFVCVGSKYDLARSTDSKDLVEEDKVLETLQRLCPPVRSNSKVRKEGQPSAIPIGSDTSSAKRQQDAELGQNGHSSPKGSTSTMRRRDSSTSTSTTKRRSLEILPDPPRSSSRGASIYHTPSSSLVHPSWMSMTKTSSSAGTPPSAPSTLSTVMNGSTETLPARPNDTGATNESGPSLLEVAESEAGDLDEEGVEDPSVLAAQDIFGVRDGIKHFHASSKTGDNVDEIFEYVARRIAARWKWQDEQDELNGFPGSSLGAPGNVYPGRPNDSLKVGGKPPGAEDSKGWRSKCC